MPTGVDADAATLVVATQGGNLRGTENEGHQEDRASKVVKEAKSAAADVADKAGDVAKKVKKAAAPKIKAAKKAVPLRREGRAQERFEAAEEGFEEALIRRVRYADLHTHTYHSDGTRSPKEVVDVALAHGIDILAISDHDNLAAYFEIQKYADERGVTLIPAMELSCEVRAASTSTSSPTPSTRSTSASSSACADSARRASAAATRSSSVSAPSASTSSAERVDELAAGGAMGRPHVARALVEAGYVASVSRGVRQVPRHRQARLRREGALPRSPRRWR